MIEIPCVDLSNLREMTDGDADLEAELFAEFITSSQEILEALQAQCDPNGNSEIWSKSAHALKGISVNLGALALGDLAKEAQESGDHPCEYKAELLVKIKAAHADVLSFLKTEM